MSKVRLTNDQFPYLQLTLTTGDRSKGCYYVGLKLGESVTVDKAEFTDQVKGLLKRKPSRLKMEELEKPVDPVVVAPTPDPLPEPELPPEEPSHECLQCGAKFRSEKKFEKHVAKHTTEEAEKPSDEPLKE